MAPGVVPSTLRPTVVGSLRCRRALDVACGWQPVEAPCPVVGVDLNRQALARATGTPGRACADAAFLPFATGSFDAVFFVAALSSVARAPDRRRALAEASRVLTGDGQVVIVDFLQNPEDPYFRQRYGRMPTEDFGTFQVSHGGSVYTAHHFTEAELVAELAAAGLTPTASVRRPVRTRTGRVTNGIELVCSHPTDAGGRVMLPEEEQG